MNRIRTLLVSLLALALAACGGGGGSILSPPDGNTAAGSVASIQLIANNTQLPSDKTGSEKVLITAIVRNASNNVVANVPVALSADSGALLVTQGTTDANGTATAELTNGLDPTNRIITVTATAGVTQTLSIAVVGTTLSLTGPPALALNSTGQFTASLKDSAGAGISGISVAFTSANGNVVSPPTRATNASGSADATLTAGTAGSGGGDTVTATAMGMTATADVSISGDSFAFIAPAPNSEVILNTGQVVQLQWLQNGNPVPNGSVVQFSTTRGSVSGVLPTAGGVAQATITSSTAGSAIVTARDPVSNTTATLNIEFVATNPASLDLQASPFTVPVSGQSTLTAVVRDVNQQVVKNAVVYFEVVNDTSGGAGIAPGSVTTNSVGTAQAVYTAGPNATAQNGVTLHAYVPDPNPLNPPLAEDSVQLTVAQQALFISLGTGNDLFEPTTASFAKEWDIIVTDSVGAAVANKVVQVSLNSVKYYKGAMVKGMTSWGRGTEGVNYQSCNDEDTNRNGILDPLEDINGSGRLEAGNIATVAAVSPSAPATNPCATANAGSTAVAVSTNNQGLARVCVIYPQNYNWWVRAEIEASASVSGTEFARAQQFLLDAKAEDVNNVSATPPGVESPFGTVLDCTDPD